MEGMFYNMGSKKEISSALNSTNQTLEMGDKTFYTVANFSKWQVVLKYLCLQWKFWEEGFLNRVLVAGVDPPRLPIKPEEVTQTFYSSFHFFPTCLQWCIHLQQWRDFGNAWEENM